MKDMVQPRRIEDMLYTDEQRAQLDARITPLIDSIQSVSPSLQRNIFLSRYGELIDTDPDAAAVFTARYIQDVQQFPLSPELMQNAEAFIEGTPQTKERIGKSLKSLAIPSEHRISIPFFARAVRSISNKILEYEDGEEALTKAYYTRRKSIYYFSLADAINAVNPKLGMTNNYMRARIKRGKQILNEIRIMDQALNKSGTFHTKNVRDGFLMIDTLLTKEPNVSCYVSSFAARLQEYIYGLLHAPAEYKESMHASRAAREEFTHAYGHPFKFPKDYHDLFLTEQKNILIQQQLADRTRSDVDEIIRKSREADLVSRDRMNMQRVKLFHLLREGHILKQHGKFADTFYESKLQGDTFGERLGDAAFGTMSTPFLREYAQGLLFRH
ncbi:MAG: hypothetical protein V1725_04240 [archaeon]